MTGSGIFVTVNTIVDGCEITLDVVHRHSLSV
jgi:hypothetical protein